MAIVNYTGDVFQSGATIIAHQVNCKGVMGAGIAATIRKKYPNVFTGYKSVCKKAYPNQESLLGQVQVVPCGGAVEKYIANCFGQNEFGSDKWVVYTDYDALEKCFRRLRHWALDHGYTHIAIPHGIGCGLAGGDWNTVLNMLGNVFQDNKVILEIWKCKPKGE